MPSTPIHRVPNDAEHERISALFLGPKAENADFLSKCFEKIVSGQAQARKNYFPTDKSFITQGTQLTSAFQQQQKDIEDALGCLLESLGKHSIPFYSPRYSAHMSVDQNLPAILGYLSTMFYNPNNVAFEASPFTTQLEIKVGEQLCTMLGFNIPDKKDQPDGLPIGWGHVTCDGTVANLESIWASRNLKFYPLSLRDAMSSKNELYFISDSFKVQTSQGEKRLLKELDIWELLNLPVEVVLDR